MLLKELINKSIYGTIGYISSEDDLHTLEQYILYNLPVLKEFKKIVVATNYNDILDSDLIIKNNNIWVKYFPDCSCISNPINRGHNFGTADLDNIIFDYCKIHNEGWLCKSANDVILQESILNKELEEADFYYMNGIGFGGMVKYDFDNKRIMNEDFYPQTNFYFINISKTDYLNDKDYINETYDKIQNIPHYDGKIWEHIDGWSCEEFLKQCVERNNLLKFHLIPLEKYYILLQTIKDNQIHDCSHKNIMIDGMCHFQYSNQPIIEI